MVVGLKTERERVCVCVYACVRVFAPVSDKDRERVENAYARVSVTALATDGLVGD